MDRIIVTTEGDLKQIVIDAIAHYFKQPMPYHPPPTACDIKLDNLEPNEISIRCYNALKGFRLNTLGDVCALTQKQFCKIRNIGYRSLTEMQAILKKHNLNFKDEQ